MGEGGRGQVGVIVDLEALEPSKVRVAWCDAGRGGRAIQEGQQEGAEERAQGGTLCSYPAL